MKRSFRALVVLMVCAAAATTSAQEDTLLIASPSKPYKLRVGVNVGLVGGGINTENATGRKVNPDFMGLPYWGATINAPFGKGSRMGMRLDVAYSSVSSLVRPYEFFNMGTNWSESFREQYNYVTVAPMINLAGFLLGMGVNFPASATMKNDAGTEFKVSTADLKTALDVRLGGQFSVWDSDLGLLTVDILAKYYFSSLYNDGTYTMGSAVDRVGIPATNVTDAKVTNMVPASITLGLSYQFNLNL